MSDERLYNDPAGGTPSEVGTQLRTDHYNKMALVEARTLQYFMPLSGVTNLPKNMGKKIKKYHYLPLLDDRNINDQGIDAAGAVISNATYKVYFQAPVTTVVFVTEANATALAADVTGGVKSGAGPWTVTFAETDSLVVSTEAIALSIQGADSNRAGVNFIRQGGNLFGSSKDPGVITDKLPLLSEKGGRVNRVGFKRINIEGSIAKFGFFDEYSKESVDFDTDADLQMHIRREMLNGAHEMTEAAVQTDLLNSAGVVRYAGAATQDSEVGATTVTYGDLLRLQIDLDNNRTPKQTRIATGTRLIDTRVIPAARYIYVGTELQPTIEAMVDLHGKPAFIPVEQYAAGTYVANGEIGTVARFRVIVVPEMQSWKGAGADASGTATHYETGEQYDIFPMLVVGDGSFTTIGFQTNGKVVNFTIYHKPPSEETADRQDPYGEMGFMSIKWYYGFLLERPERLGLVKTSAKL